jgi:hypothetical protein
MYWYFIVKSANAEPTETQSEALNPRLILSNYACRSNDRSAAAATMLFCCGKHMYWYFIVKSTNAEPIKTQSKALNPRLSLSN